MRWIWIICCCSWLNMQAQSDTATVKHLDISPRIQFAGLQGMFSGGALMNFKNERIQLGLMYGFSPGKLGANDYQGVTIRSVWSLRDYPINDRFAIAPHIAISVNLEVGGTTFFFLPEEFPEDYYAPQSLHGIVGIGGKLKMDTGKGQLALTLETVTLDTYLWYTIIQREIRFYEAWSLSLGLEYRFNSSMPTR